MPVNKRVEKYAIYSKGFRGLPDGWHNIRSCNFLIGENSTGKSSFLQLIEIIDSREHMVFFDLCGIVDGVDTPFDVLSRVSGSKEVTVGFLVKENNTESKGIHDGVFGRLISYKRVADDLLPYKISIISGKKMLRIKAVKGGVGHKFSNFLYDDDKKHKENGLIFEEIHNKSGDKFKINHTEDVSDAPAIAWVPAIQSIFADRKNGRSSAFLRAYPPLKCLQHGPIRATTQRLYYGYTNEFSSTGEHFPYIMKEMSLQNPGLLKAISDFGKVSGLFDNITISVVRTAVKDKPFSVQVEKNGKYFYVDELGYGVGQVLPIITDVLISNSERAFLIQQPELHLHPRAQAALGDVLFEATKNGGAFVVETHSDFIIDRYRKKIMGGDSSARSQIVYFEKKENGENTAHEIELNQDGTMSDTPEGYRSFFLKEKIDNLELN